MIPGKGKITSTVGDFGKTTLEVVKEEIKKVGEEMEDQLGVSPQVNSNKDRDEKEDLNNSIKKEKIKTKEERLRIREVEEQLAIARQQIEEEREKKKEIRDSQSTEDGRGKPVVQGLPNVSGVEEPLPSLDETLLPPSKPRRGFFPQGAEKFKKKE